MGELRPNSCWRLNNTITMAEPLCAIADAILRLIAVERGEGFKLPAESCSTGAYQFFGRILKVIDCWQIFQPDLKVFGGYQSLVTELNCT